MIRFSRFSTSVLTLRQKYEFADKYFKKAPGTTHQFSVDHYKKELNHFIWSLDTKHLETKCVSFGISQEIYLKAISNFKEQLKNDALSYLKHDDILAHLQVSNPVDKLVLPAFLKYIRINYPDSVKKLQMLSSKLNLENPSNLFPDARQMKREIIMHVGPTNS
jgi:hypothetical protein